MRRLWYVALVAALLLAACSGGKKALPVRIIGINVIVIGFDQYSTVGVCIRMLYDILSTAFEYAFIQEK